MSWEEHALGEVAQINPKLVQALNPDEHFDFIPMASMHVDGDLAIEEQRPYSSVAKGFTQFCKDDVLLAKITPCFENNKVGLATIKTDYGFGSTEFHVVRANTNILFPRYLHYFLRTKKVNQSGEFRMTGSAGQRRVPKLFLEELKIPLPPLSEQKRIARILDQTDALRRQRQRALDHLNQLGQSIFYEMFGDVSNWPSKPLFDLGHVHTGKTPPTARTELFHGSIPFVTPGDLESDGVIKRSLTEEGALFSKLVKTGSTLVCCIGATIGKIGQAKEPSSFNQQINAIEWSQHINPSYGTYALITKKPEIIHKGKGSSTTLPILKKSSFEKIEIAVPSLPLQRKFSEVISQIDNEIKKHEFQLKQTNSLFASLQQRAFRGEL